MSKFEKFITIRNGAKRSDPSVSNLGVLGLPPETRAIHILWIYPDVLEMHGGRGDAMALLHFSNLMELPCELRRLNTLEEEIPFEWADLMLFPSGDLSCMADLSRALMGKKEAFQRFADGGGLILAIGSTGAVLAKQTAWLSGSVSPGLGLLGMEMTQRRTVFGDDLWVRLEDGSELTATQVQLADVKLLPGQEPFAQVIYGRGNCGDGLEGARTGSVIFTHCLGPVLTKNPHFAEALLRQCADHAGISVPKSLDPDDIALELQALVDVREFVQKKMNGEIH